MNAPPNLRILAMMEANSVTGPAKNLLGFCRWLATPEGAQSGIRISIATFTRNAGVDIRAFAEAVGAAGVDLHLVQERFRYDPRVVRQIRRIVAEVRPEIIQTHNNKSHLLVRLVSELRKQRLWFAFHHGYTYTDLKQRMFNQVDRISLRSADRVVTVCSAFAAPLVARGVGVDRIRILHNSAIPFSPASPAERTELRGKLEVGIDDAMILSVGRLSREKGHAILLRALERLGSRAGKWKLVIVGTGPEHDALVRLARALGLAGLVRFAGSHPDVRPFYQSADLFALPSLTEGSSNVLLEAMVAKLPIAATRAGGNPEIITHDETGLLVPVGDFESLASAIARLLGDRRLASRLAESAFSRGSREFSVERYRHRLVGYYCEALNARQAGAGHFSARSADAN